MPKRVSYGDRFAGLTKLNKMLACKLVFVVLTALVADTLTYKRNNEEAVVETVNEDEWYREKLKIQLDTNYIETLGENYNPFRKSKKRSRLLQSYPQSPIIDVMRMMPAFNYAPKNPSDIFDFLRDSYPLPGGKRSYAFRSFSILLAHVKNLVRKPIVVTQYSIS